MITGIESAKLKLVRAAEHIDTVRKHVAAYASSDPHEVVEHPDHKQKINAGADPDPIVAIVAGEAVHQIRSALDYIAFDLVKMNTGNIQLPANWEEHCLFPLWLNIPKKVTTYNCFSHILPGISKAIFTYIESVQPYHGNTEVSNYLRLLAELSKIDKHRYITIIKPRLDVNESITTSLGSYRRVRRIQDGEELDPVADVWVDGCSSVDVKRSITSSVSFGEPTLCEWTTYQIPVEELLESCLSVVARRIVPAISEILDNG